MTKPAVYASCVRQAMERSKGYVSHTDWHFLCRGSAEPPVAGPERTPDNMLPVCVALVAVLTRCHRWACDVLGSVGVTSVFHRRSVWIPWRR